MKGTREQQIAANHQRQLVPQKWLLEFNSWSNDSLDSLADDDSAPADVKAWAGWELEYRDAFGLFIDLAPDGRPRRTEVASASGEQALANRMTQEAQASEANRKRMVGEMQARLRGKLGSMQRTG